MWAEQRKYDWPSLAADLPICGKLNIEDANTMTKNVNKTEAEEAC